MKTIPVLIAAISVATLSAVITFSVAHRADLDEAVRLASSSSNAAKGGHLFVAAPVVSPSVFAVSESVDLRVTDAWVEHPMHTESRPLGLFPRNVVDSTYRLRVHLTRVPHSDSVWTNASQECFATVEFTLDGQRPSAFANFERQDLTFKSPARFADTVRLQMGKVTPMAPLPANLPADAQPMKGTECG